MKNYWIYFVTLLGLLSSNSGFGQATFALRNRYAIYRINAPVFDAQGIPLEGTNFVAELSGGPAPGNLAPARNQQGRVIVPFASQGYLPISNPDVFIPTVGELQWAWLQLRAWDARLGATYEEVAARGLGGYGESPLFYAQGGAGGQLPTLPGPLIGLQSFQLRPTTAAVLMRGIHRQGDQVVIEWNPGFKS